MGNALVGQDAKQAIFDKAETSDGEETLVAESVQKSLRLNITLPPASTARLEKLREVTESSSNAEVIRKALRWFAYLVDEQEKGNTIQIEKKDGGGIFIVKMF